MKRHLVIAGAALAFAFIASGANAQVGTDECGFEHPQKAKQLKANLTQNFISCTAPNSMTESGTPSCTPPVTPREDTGSDPSSWMWNEAKGQGSVSIKAGKNKIVSLLNPPDDSADLFLQLKLQGVVDAAGPATGDGTLFTLSRATLRDRNNTPDDGDDSNGDENADDVNMTVFDFPAPFGFDLEEGKGQLKTSANAFLNTIPLNGLPKCSNIELVDLGVLDENGNRFAGLGTFLPAK